MARAGFETPYTVYPAGVELSKRGHTQFRPWDEIKAVWIIVTITYHGRFLFHTEDHSRELLYQDGVRLKLKNLSEELVTWIEQEAYRSLVPRVQAQWASGQPVWFGPVSLSPAGIHSAREVLPWGDVQSVKAELNENDIVIRRRGCPSPWMRLEGVAIANPAIFFQLVRENTSRQDR